MENDKGYRFENDGKPRKNNLDKFGRVVRQIRLFFKPQEVSMGHMRTTLEDQLKHAGMHTANSQEDRPMLDEQIRAEAERQAAEYRQQMLDLTTKTKTLLDNWDQTKQTEYDTSNGEAVELWRNQTFCESPKEHGESDISTPPKE